LRRVVHDGRALSTALGFWGAYMPLGAALGLLLGPIAYDLVGWRIAWAVLGMASAFFAWGVATQVALDHDGVKQGAGPSMAERLRTTLSAPGPWCVALAFLVYSGQWLAVVGFLPTIYTGAGWPLLWVGVLSALAAGVNMAGNILAGRLLARGVAPVRLLVLAYLSMALGAYGAFGSGAGAVIQYAAVLLFSAVGGLIPGTLFGLAVRLAPNGFTVSTTVGWVQQLSSLGQFAGPPAVAWVAVEAGGWHHTAWMTGACSLAGVLLAMLLQRLVGGLPPMGPPAAAKAH
jgi:cyanate permease